MASNTVNANSIPVTLITGYLGAGKTTLLCHIIDREKRKIAILMNEFGQIDIDGKVIKGKNIDMKELSGGCVCCSMTGEFELAIKEILEKVNPEWIIVETTGVAEPGAIAVDIEENLPEVYLDSIITVADSDALVKYPSLGHTGREQIELADVIIMNKIDLLDVKKSAEVEAKLRSINPSALLVKAIRAKVPPQFFYGLRKKHIIEKHETHNIEEEFFPYETEAKLNMAKFAKFLTSLPRSVFRAKGFANCEDNKTYLFNYVAGRYELEEFDHQDKSQLIFIGKGLSEDKEKIVKKLAKLLG